MECIWHGIQVIKIILEQEKLQLLELQKLINKTSVKLEKFQEIEVFQKLNEQLKGQVERAQKKCVNN